MVDVLKQKSDHFYTSSVVGKHVSIVGFHTHSWIYQRHDIDVSTDVTTQRVLRCANSQLRNALKSLMLANEL